MIAFVLRLDALPADRGGAAAAPAGGRSTRPARAPRSTRTTRASSRSRASSRGSLWAHPAARRAALAATAAAAVGFLPWLSGLQGRPGLADDRHPVGAAAVRRRRTCESSLVHWAIGFPYATPSTRVRELPGRAGAGRARARARARRSAGSRRGAARAASRAPDRRAGARDRARRRRCRSARRSSARSAPNLFGHAQPGGRPGRRSRSASPRCSSPPGRGSASPRRRWRSARSRSAGSRCSTRTSGGPSTEAAIAFVDRDADPATSWSTASSLSPAGVPTAIDVAFAGRRRVYPLGRAEVRYDPFRILARAAADGRTWSGARPPPRRGGRLFLLLAPGAPLAREALAAVPPGSRRVAAAQLRRHQPASRSLVFERSDGERRVVGRERRAAEEPALDREARASASTGPMRSGAGTSRRRRARRPARRSAA